MNDSNRFVAGPSWSDHNKKTLIHKFLKTQRHKDKIACRTLSACEWLFYSATEIELGIDVNRNTIEL